MVVEKPDILTLFNEALSKATFDERAKFLDSVCGEDHRLRMRLDELLRAHEDAGGFLGGTDATWEPLGTTIGPYMLLEQIGAGGFGVVFLAEQATPIRRRVALKIVKPGMDTRQVIARFEAERQALALMDHPGIAKVFDAGVTEQGRSYFVMELVQGVPINEYCDECRLPTRERLSLFIAVCHAVQHAHQKGIIHRDIKPTNVLVAMQDGRPVPKIIDFGIAKATEQRLTDRTLTTAFAQMVGTPLYMSPEQAELSRLGVDTRTDIYSLGVLLYELLTGMTPFDKDRLHAASYEVLRRIIREEEPPRPSSRLTTLATGEAATIAEHRRTDARRLGQQVRGELDWIVMQCLEKDRNRRYDSVGGLAEDLERFLRDEPVQACPPSALYRVKKFARRNRTAAAFGALLFFGLIGLTISNLQLIRERNAKAAALEQATSEGARAKAVSELIWTTLASSYPRQAKGPEYTVRELLDDASTELDRHFSHKPQIEAAMRSVIGRSYWRLGVYDRAELHLERALDLHRQAYGSHDERIADSLLDCCWTLSELGRIAELQTRASEAATIYRHLEPSPRVTSSLAETLYLTVISQLQTGDLDGYRANCNRLVELPIDAADAMSNSRPVWPLCLAPNSLDDESRLVRRAEEYLNKNLQYSPHYSRLVFGAALYRAGRYGHAARQLTESIDIYPDSPDSGFDTIHYQQLFLAMTQWQLGNRDEASRSLDTIRLSVAGELKDPSTKWARRTSLTALLDEAESLIRLQKKSDAVKQKPDS